MESPIACQQHNHQNCISDALLQAEQLCNDRNVQLTSLREQVLRLIWISHKPLGAYALMDMLSDRQARRVAPPTVYRTLSFLQEQGFIHKIHSLNAYVGCADPDQRHQGHFLICKHCGVAVECNGNRLNEVLVSTADEVGFKVDQQTVEILGSCPSCLKEIDNKGGVRSFE